MHLVQLNNELFRRRFGMIKIMILANDTCML